MQPRSVQADPKGLLSLSAVKRIARGAVLVGTLLIATACGSAEARIFAAYGEPRSDRLELNIETCNAVLSVDVEETTDEVRVLVTKQDDSGGDEDDCADQIFVSLDAPLGDRVVIDESTGERFDVQLPD